MMICYYFVYRKFWRVTVHMQHNVVTPARRAWNALPTSADQFRLLLSDSCSEQECARYKIIKEIGRGAFGAVYAAQDEVKNNEMVALKAVLTLTLPGVIGEIWKEIEVLHRLRGCRHVVQFRRLLRPCAVETVPPAVVFSMDYYHCSTLQQYLGSGCVHVETAKRLVYELLNGVSFIHRNRIVHRDLSHKNIIIVQQSSSNALEVRIADFGSCMPSSSSSDIARHTSMSSVYYVTRWWRPPEMWCDIKSEDPDIYTMPMSIMCDMWSVGCLIAEIVLGKPLFVSVDMKNFINVAVNLIGAPKPEDLQEYASFSFKRELMKVMIGARSSHGHQQQSKLHMELMDKNVDPKLSDMVLSMLRWNPHKRISAAELLHSPYFDCLRSGDEDDDGRPGCEFSEQIADEIRKLRVTNKKIKNLESSASEEARKVMAALLNPSKYAE